jgi:hypothetical protein
MDAVLKRLVALNQILLVVLSLCFFSCYGRRVSAEALDVARDLEALQNLKGKDADPALSCASPALQQALDEELRKRPEGAEYGHVRDALFAFLKTGLHLQDVDINQAKFGGPAGPRAYFLIDPELESPGKPGLCLREGNEALPALPVAYGAPDSVETIVERSRVYSASRTIFFPVKWTPPADPKSVVPASCLAPPAPPPPAGAEESPPASLMNNDCQLTAVVYDGQSIAFVWSTKPQMQRAPLSAADSRKTTPATESQLTESDPFLLAHMPSVENGWILRIQALGDEKNDAGRKVLVDRYGGLSIDTALAQSQKTYSDLVGSVTLLGQNLLPEWFPLAVDGVLLVCLFSIFVTCRQARTLPGWKARREKLVELESVVFLSLLTPTATLITWALLPLVALGMAVSYAGGAGLVADFALAAVASALGGVSCAVFWRREGAAAGTVKATGEEPFTTPPA